MSRKAYIIIGFASAALLISMGMRYSFGLYLAPVSAALALDVQVFSLAIAFQNLLWGLSQPFAGAIADKYGSGRVIVGGALLHVAGLLVLANADSAWDLHSGAGIILGIAGSGCTFAVILGVVGRAVAPERRSLALGVAAAAGTMGQVVVVPFNQVLINDYGWQAGFLVMAILMAALVPMAAALTGNAETELNEDAAGTAEPVISGVGEAILEARSHGGFWLLTAGFFVCGFQIMFIIAHFPNFLTSAGLPGWLPGTAIAVIGVANVVGTMATGWLGGRYSKKYLLSALYALRAIVFAVFLAVPLSEASVLVFSGAIGLIWLGTIPLTSGLVGQIFGVRYMATLFGIVFLGHQLGSFLAVWLGGVIFDATGSYDLIWQTSIGLGILAALLHLPIADTPIERQAPAPA
ncbi:MAG: MFS transporter [Rhodospirillaceae bacterium]|nr:MFS transporter [Rhodospirillaceae bacterium]